MIEKKFEALERYTQQLSQNLGRAATPPVDAADAATAATMTSTTTATSSIVDPNHTTIDGIESKEITDATAGVVSGEAMQTPVLSEHHLETVFQMTSMFTVESAVRQRLLGNSGSVSGNTTSIGSAHSQIAYFDDCDDEDLLDDIPELSDWDHSDAKYARASSSHAFVAEDIVFTRCSIGHSVGRPVVCSTSADEWCGRSRLNRKQVRTRRRSAPDNDGAEVLTAGDMAAASRRERYRDVDEDDDDDDDDDDDMHLELGGAENRKHKKRRSRSSRRRIKTDGIDVDLDDDDDDDDDDGDEVVVDSITKHKSKTSKASKKLHKSTKHKDKRSHKDAITELREDSLATTTPSPSSSSTTTNPTKPTKKKEKKEKKRKHRSNELDSSMEDGDIEAISTSEASSSPTKTRKKRTSIGSKRSRAELESSSSSVSPTRGRDRSIADADDEQEEEEEEDDESYLATNERPVFYYTRRRYECLSVCFS